MASKINLGRLPQLLLALIVSVGIFFAWRAPFLSQPPFSEEGLFASILLERPSSPNYFRIAHVGGEDFFGIPEHPAPMYEYIRGLGLLAKLLPFSSMSEHARSATLRTMFSLAALTVLLLVVACGMTADPKRRGLALATALVVSSVPASLCTSIELQLDGAVGVALCGLCALGLVCVDRFGISRRILALAAFGSFLVGLGKQEWSLALLAACGTLFLPSSAGSGTRKGLGFALLLGLIAGNLSSFLFDPVNYLGGLDVMKRIVAANGTVATSGMDRALGVLLARLRLLAPLLVLIGVVAVWLTREREWYRVSPAWRVAYGFAITLTAGYIGSVWSDMPRYFAPAHAVLLVALVALIAGSKLQLPRMAVGFAGIILFALTVDTAVFVGSSIRRHVYVASVPGIQLPPNNSWTSDGAATRGDCVPLIHSGAVYDKPDREFVNGSTGAEDARRILARYGRKLCE